MPSNRRDALLVEYGEVSSNFRMLTDIRFKLLAFLPLAAGVAAPILARGNATMLTLAFSLFGLVVTIGLVTYNTRNDQLYDTLVARGGHRAESWHPRWRVREPPTTVVPARAR